MMMMMTASWTFIPRRADPSVAAEKQLQTWFTGDERGWEGSAENEGDEYRASGRALLRRLVKMTLAYTATGRQEIFGCVREVIAHKLPGFYIRALMEF